MIRRAWLVLLLVLLPSLAWAQASAVNLAKDAKAHYDRGEWAEALELFEQAEAQAHSPVLVLYAARCHRNLGHLVRARALLEKVANEELTPNSPSPFVNARNDARADLSALLPRIPKIAIDRSRVPNTWKIQIDGEPRQSSSVEVDPGAHLVTATADGTERFREEVEVAEGATATVTIVETATTPSPVPSPDPGPTQPPSGGEPGGSSIADYAPGLSLLGVSVVTLAVGVIMRVIAIQNVNDVKERCVEGSCLREDETVIDDAVTFQTISTVLFAVGGAAMATGIVLLIVLPDDDTAVSIGPGGVGLRGVF